MRSNERVGGKEGVEQKMRRKEEGKDKEEEKDDK